MKCYEKGVMVISSDGEGSDRLAASFPIYPGFNSESFGRPYGRPSSSRLLKNRAEPAISVLD
jgi:hypothetical protein